MLYATPPALLILLPLALVAALLLGPRVARAVGAGWPVGVLLVGSVAVILSFTLVPMRFAYGTDEGLGCLVPDLGVLASRNLLRINDESLNVLLFVPLGIAIALLPAGRRAPFLVGAALLPWAIEITQLVVPGLHRSCQSVDLTTNLLGLAIGLGLGVVGRWADARIAPR